MKLLIPLALILIFMPLTALAAESGTSDVINNVFKFFAVILQTLQAVLWPILLLLGGLLNNDLLFSGGMQTMLLNIWSAIRDFVNILFVLGLLFIAIYNIIGLAKDEFAIPKILPTFAIALIAVNFSFLMCKVVLDVVNVTTTAIFAVPMASTSLQKYKEDAGALKSLDDKICNDMMNMKEVKETDKKNPYCEQAEFDADKKEMKYKLSDAGKQFFSTFNSRNAALVMAVELMGITDIDKVEINKVKDITTLAINTIFSLIFFIIYATAFIALFVTMLVRVIILWISIALMPISFLGIAFSNIKKELGKNDPMELFFTHALIPVKVSVVLTIGMIMITQLKQIVPGGTFATQPATLNAITSNMSTIQEIIAGLATAAFIWIAAFEAMKGTMAEGITNTIKKTVEKAGLDVAKMPLYVPILPTKGGEKVGLAAVLPALAGANPATAYNKERQAEIDKRFADKGTRLGKQLDEAKTQESAKKAVANTIIESNYKVSPELQTKMAATIEGQKLTAVLKQPSGYGSMKEFVEALRGGKVSEEKMKEFYAANPQNLAAQASGVPEEASTAKDVAKKAKDSGEKKGVDVKEIDDEAKALETQATDLATKPDPDQAKLATARDELKKAREALERKVAARDNFNESTSAAHIKDTVAADGTISSPAKANEMKANADRFVGSLDQNNKPANEAAVLKALTARVKEALGPNVDAEKIAKQILAGS